MHIKLIKKINFMKETIDDTRFVELMKFSNRSKNQTNFLFELLNEDFNLLVKLERKIKEKLVFYCPSTLDEVNQILNK